MRSSSKNFSFLMGLIANVLELAQMRLILDQCPVLY